MAGKSAFQEDLARYPGPVRWSDPALWAIAVYRVGQRIVAIRSERTRWLLMRLYFPIARVVETVTKVSLPVFAEIGGGLRVVDCGVIFINGDVKIGRNCTLRRGVTIGNTREDGATPVIGDNVDIGAYAQILGGVHIGDGAKIEPMTVVLKDVPAGAVAAGIPAKIRAGGHAGVVSAPV